MTADRETERAALATHPGIGAEPQHKGRTHPHRRNLRGVRTQVRMVAQALIRANDPTRFLVLGRPRSGTTLLGHLLNQVPVVTCDNELMQNRVVAPLHYMRALARRSPTPVYGFKLLSYQMTDVQRVRDPLGFLEAADARGWRLIHLRRRTYPQTLSLAKAHSGSGYFDRPGETRPDAVHVPVDRFTALLEWNLAMLDFEDRLMAQVPHLRLQYEDDLEPQTSHQSTVDRICADLDIAPAPVAASMRRSGGDGGRVATANADALREAVARGPHAHLLAEAGAA